MRCRADDQGILDVIGAQMAVAGSGSLATGLEEEVTDLRRKKQAEEDRRLGRIRKRQEVFSGKMVLGVKNLGDTGTGEEPSQESLMVLTEQLSMEVGGGRGDDGLEVGRDRVRISKEMQAKLDRFIEGQVRTPLFHIPMPAAAFECDASSVLSSKLTCSVPCALCIADRSGVLARRGRVHLGESLRQLCLLLTQAPGTASMSS